MGPVLAVFAAAWTLEVQLPTYSVWSRSRDDGGTEYRMTGTFASPFEAVRKAVQDPLGTGASPQLVEERLLGVHGSGRIFYNRYHLPVVDDLDYCILVEVEDRPGGAMRQKWRPWPDCPPSPDGVERMTANEGFWEIWPGTDPRSTRFVMEQYTDPGGWLPRWLVRSATRDGLVESVPSIERAARRIVALEKAAGPPEAAVAAPVRGPEAVP